MKNLFSALSLFSFDSGNNGDYVSKKDFKKLIDLDAQLAEEVGNNREFITQITSFNGKIVKEIAQIKESSRELKNDYADMQKQFLAILEDYERRIAELEQ